MPPITPEAQRGRVLLLIAFATTLLGDSCVIALKTARIGLTPAFIGSVLRLLVTVVLFYAVWRGVRWVRWLLVVLMGLGLLVMLPVTLLTVHPVAIGIAVQLGITVALLAMPKSVSAFIEYQRMANDGNT